VPSTQDTRSIFRDSPSATPIYSVISALRNPAVHSNFTGTIVEQTRAQADATKVILNALKDNELAAPGIDKILKSTGCISSLDDAIQAVEEYTQLLEANGPELNYLVSYVQRLEGEKDIIKLTKASADILRILDDLQSLFNTPVRCNASLEERIRAFRVLSQVLDEVLNKNYGRLPKSTRAALLFSSKVTSEVQFFLQNMKASVAGFNCVEGQDNSAAVYNLIGDIMENVAFLFEGLGKVDRPNKIRNQGAFIKSIVDSFDDLGLDSGYRCGDPWDYKSLAQDVEDLAGIIESVGVQKLSVELGLDLDINQF